MKIVRKYLWLVALALLGCGGHEAQAFLPLGGSSPAAACAVSTSSPLPAGTVSSAYSTTLATTNCVAPITWSIISGSLPTGISLTGSTGVLAGTPTTASTYTFTAQAADSASHTPNQAFSLTVNSGGGSFAITTSSTLPGATNGQPYSQTFATTGGTGAVGCAITSAPSTYNNGLMFQPGGMTLTGVANLLPPNVAENDSFTLTCYDNGGHTATGTFALNTAVATGSLATSSTASLPAGTKGSPYFAPSLCSGGVPPYYQTLTGHTSTTAPTNSGQSYGITTQGMLQTAPTVTGTDTFTVECQDLASSSSTSSTNFYSYTVNNTIAFGTPTVMPFGMQGAKYRYQMRTYAGGGTYTYSLISGGPPGLSLSSTGLWTGTPTSLGTFPSVVVQVTDGTTPITKTFTMAFAKNAQVSRPSYNASVTNGPFVLNGQLYDPNGWPIRIRGFNRGHIDQQSSALVPSNINTARVWTYPPTYSASTAFTTYIQPQFIANGIMPIITQDFDAAGNSTAGSNAYGASTGTNSGGLGAMLQLWQTYYSVLASSQESLGPINVANEWGTDFTNNYIAYLGVTGTVTSISGAVITINTVSATNPFAPAASVGAYLFVSGSSGSQFIQISSVGGSSGAWTVTATASVTTTASGAVLCGGAVAILRNIVSPGVGYTVPLLIDLPYHGEDSTELQNHGAAILASDPLQNVIFAAHLYGASTIVGPVTAATVSGGNATVTMGLSTNGQTIQSGYYANYIGGGAQAYFAGLGGLTGINGLFDTTTYPTGGTYPTQNTVTTIGLTVAGSWTSGGYLYDSYYYALAMQSFASIATTNNLALIIGEIGPGYGADGQYTAPQQSIQAMEHYGLGYMFWSIDDSSPFNMTAGSNGAYVVPSDLTPYGQDVINNPTYGLAALATYIPFYN